MSVISPDNLPVGPFFSPQSSLMIGPPRLLESSNEFINVLPDSRRSICRPDCGLLNESRRQRLGCLILGCNTVPKAQQEELGVESLVNLFLFLFYLFPTSLEPFSLVECVLRFGSKVIQTLLQGEIVFWELELGMEFFVDKTYLLAMASLAMPNSV